MSLNAFWKRGLHLCVNACTCVYVYVCKHICKLVYTYVRTYCWLENIALLESIYSSHPTFTRITITISHSTEVLHYLLQSIGITDTLKSLKITLWKAGLTVWLASSRSSSGSCLLGRMCHTANTLIFIVFCSQSIFLDFLNTLSHCQ